jgi:hypothetical protein
MIGSFPPLDPKSNKNDLTTDLTVGLKDNSEERPSREGALPQTIASTGLDRSILPCGKSSDLILLDGTPPDKLPDLWASVCSVK